MIFTLKTDSKNLEMVYKALFSFLKKKTLKEDLVGEM